MKRDELQERTKRFALRVLKLIEHLPKTIAGRVRRQSAREECYFGRSELRGNATGMLRDNEFASKLGVVAEESDESLYWLELIRDGHFISQKRIAPLILEANELTAIFTTGRRTSSQNQTSTIKPQTPSPP